MAPSMDNTTPYNVDSHSKEYPYKDYSSSGNVGKQESLSASPNALLGYLPAQAAAVTALGNCDAFGSIQVCTLTSIQYQSMHTYIPQL